VHSCCRTGLLKYRFRGCRSAFLGGCKPGTSSRRQAPGRWYGEMITLTGGRCLGREWYVTHSHRQPLCCQDYLSYHGKGTTETQGPREGLGACVHDSRASPQEGFSQLGIRSSVSHTLGIRPLTKVGRVYTLQLRLALVHQTVQYCSFVLLTVSRRTTRSRSWGTASTR
jgi:hypothetical protein